MHEATVTVSPNRQYLGIACPTTPAMDIRQATTHLHADCVC